MNHKGQVLVLFLLLLPVLLLLTGLVIDTGITYLEKRKIEHVIQDTIQYGLKHLEEDNVKNNMTQLLKENINDINEIVIQIENQTITLKVEKKMKSVFGMKQPTIQLERTETRKEE